MEAMEIPGFLRGKGLANESVQGPKAEPETLLSIECNAAEDIVDRLRETHDRLAAMCERLTGENRPRAEPFSVQGGHLTRLRGAHNMGHDLLASCSKILSELEQML